MAQTIKILFFGDVIGIPGQALFQKWAYKLKAKYKADAIIVNGENSTKNGKGITSKIMDFFKHNGADVVTSGNHIWQNKEIYMYLNEHTDLIRPANFPSDCPGKGYSLFDVNGITVGVLNLQGRIFMREDLDCPFKAAKSILTLLKTKTKIILVDFHAEATSEKCVLANYLDGEVSCVFGTHTHVQTADERILPKGTAYISDAGCCGALNSAIGMKLDSVLKRFLTQMPSRFLVETDSPFLVNGVCVEIDTSTGEATKIEKISFIDEELQVSA